MGEAKDIIGIWELRTFVAVLEDGAEVLPMGPNPGGRLVYTSDGFMSAHLWNPDIHLTDVRNNAERSYFSYCGDWTLKGDQVCHHVHVATEPAWTGIDKIRTLVLQDDGIQLNAEKVFYRGETGQGVLQWERRSK
jgi:hypothetical protein